jgi:hypothetical protein
MRPLTRILWILGAIILVAPAAVPKEKPAKGDGQGSIVITFKDGHQESIRLADVARIEFSTPTSSPLPAGSARFLGDWKVGDGIGGTFTISLKVDGQATKTNGNSSGTWKVVGGEAQVSWDDGWHDVIRKVGNKYQKAAYSPGRSLSGQPSNVADAVYTEPN